MKHIAMIPEYMSRIDFTEAQALRIFRIVLEPSTGRMTLHFYEKGFPPMITCAKTFGVPAPGSWLVKKENNAIEFKSDLEFRAEYRLIN